MAERADQVAPRCDWCGSPSHPEKPYHLKGVPCTWSDLQAARHARGVDVDLVYLDDMISDDPCS